MGLRPAAGDEAAASRRADRVIGDRLCEAHALDREPVQMRRCDVGVAGTAQCRTTHLVGQNEKQVGRHLSVAPPGTISPRESRPTSASLSWTWSGWGRRLSSLAGTWAVG